MHTFFFSICVQIIFWGEQQRSTHLPTVTLWGTPMHNVVCFHLKNEILVQELFCCLTLFAPRFLISQSLHQVNLWSTRSWGRWFILFLVFLFVISPCLGRFLWSTRIQYAGKTDSWGTLPSFYASLQRQEFSHSPVHFKVERFHLFPPACEYGKAVRTHSWRGPMWQTAGTSLKFARAMPSSWHSTWSKQTLILLFHI